jgi:predicted phage terminase large subunit-like protein
VRYWDLAATEKKITGKKRNDPDETVGTKMSWDKQYFYIEHQHGGFWEWLDIKKQILETAKEDGAQVEIWVEQEPGSGGKNQVAEIANYIKDQLPGWFVNGHSPRDDGDKVMRANYWFAEAKLGLIFVVAGSWVKPCFKQLDSFPGRHDDRIDSISGGRLVLAPIEMWKKIPFLRL